MYLLPVFLLLLLFPAKGVVIDRTAIIVGRIPILDSDIERDIRVTALLNGEPIDLGAASRKKAASRLIDQEIIRQQIRLGGYSVASQAEVDPLFQSERDQFRGPNQFRQILAKYAITEREVKDRLAWQLTVLHFIDAMFRPQVMVSDPEIQHYYESHTAQFGSRPLTAVRQSIVDTITGERVNQLLESWLDQNRKSAKIVYLEKSLA